MDNNHIDCHTFDNTMHNAIRINKELNQSLSLYMESGYDVDDEIRYKKAHIIEKMTNGVKELYEDTHDKIHSLFGEMGCKGAVISCKKIICKFPSIGEYSINTDDYKALAIIDKEGLENIFKCRPGVGVREVLDAFVKAHKKFMDGKHTIAGTPFKEFLCSIRDIKHTYVDIIECAYDAMCRCKDTIINSSDCNDCEPLIELAISCAYIAKVTLNDLYNLSDTVKKFYDFAVKHSHEIVKDDRVQL